MKQYLFFATAIATASLFTGCSNNEYVGDQPEALNGTDGAIAFSMGKANTTRGAEKTDGEAADTLNNVFYVYGEKYYTGTPETPQTVFDTYKVKYIDHSANPSASNTKDWEYVGKLWNVNEKSSVNGGVEDQTIKYWDYSADHYTFYAFSAKPEDVNAAAPKIKVSKIKDTPTAPSYTVSIEEGAHIEDLYFADKNVVNKTDYSGKDGVTANKEVRLKFRNLASKVRVGFYETVPGYSIQINKMYPANDAGSDFASTGNASGFMAMCPNTVASQGSKITVKYSTGSGKENQAYVAAKTKLDDNNLDAEKTLTLGSGVFGSALKTTSSSPTWDKTNGNYTFFWPQTGNDKPLKIKVDYTLTATDQTEENKKETITVTGATATVPAAYVAWKANTAYTYIFKISDNTNGTTGGSSDPKGLYPITFDAAVVDMDEKTYLTTVSTPSVTVSQNGTNFVDPGAGFVFTRDEDIILKVMLNGTEPETNKCTIYAQFVETYNYNNTAEQNVNNTWGSPLTEYKLTKRTESTPENGYWVLKVDCKYKEGESPEEKTATTYVIIRVGSAEVGPANQ